MTTPVHELQTPGWVVLDPDGNVVASGPGMVLHMAGDIGGTDQEVEDADGCDSSGAGQ